MVTRWLGKEFDLKDGDHVKVTGVYMCANQRVNLRLQSTRGELYLTTVELEFNKVSAK
jgi:DNA replicative helicase MCM subunit Mcm2 (Cdc46/Mcm family)